MKVAIVDGNNLAYKAYAAMKESRGGLLTNSMGVPTTVLFSLMRTFNMLAEKAKFDRIVLTWDTSGSYYRRGLFKLYKKHRKYVDMKDYFAELDAAREHFDILGFNQIIVKGIEADDVIGYLAHYLRNEDHRVVIVSDDKDFYQVLRPGIKIWRPIKNEFITYDDVVDEYDMQPSELPRIKAITGEDTDFIPGVCDIDKKNMKLIKCNLGEATAIKMVKGMKSLSEAIDKWQDKPTSKRPFKEILINKRKMILKSYKLARIRTKEKYYLDWEKKLFAETMPKVLEEKKPKLKTIIRLKTNLEIKSMNIIQVLKGLGIAVQGATY